VDGQHFRFSTIALLDIGGFNNQNAIFDLKFEPTSPPNEGVTWTGPAYLVTLEPSFGIGRCPPGVYS
jgi:hypothetical protein